ncbi:hypothetical protein GQ53DRAFT_824074 [Thozetella sp. PMI_491]|nr:hypothetical protein GQ53DRAFT_824074 [Thozetella sp. PMI_491]
MSSLLPVALYGLEVPPGETLVPAAIEFPATIRITMAAIDPTQPPETDSEGNVPSVPRSTLKLVKTRGYDGEDDEDDEEADEYLESLLANAEDDDDDDEEDDEEDDEDEAEEPNGGPSDPAKSKKARREAALKKLLEAAEEESDEEMEDADAKANGVKKGKEKASDDDEDDSEDDDSDDGFDLEEYVVCTLDTERNYQQTLDITVGENERVFFIVSGTHAVHLTGNYVVHEDDEDDDSDDEEDDEDYDLPPGLEDILDDSDVSDELDAIERIEEIEEDEEEAPKLVAAESKKSKKRPAEDEAEGLDELIAKDESKLSKKQLKKLKNNKGEAVASEKETTPKSDKKVQFAKNLEQGPTGPAKDKAAPGVKVVQGVTIDDRKPGKGRTVKSGDKVGMRYIGKLENGKVFDSNKKGAPFTFKVGKGEVIKGWDIGIEGMSVGGERRLTIPAHHAYGSKSLPGIPANSTLIFDVKLLEIK